MMQQTSKDFGRMQIDAQSASLLSQPSSSSHLRNSADFTVEHERFPLPSADFADSRGVPSTLLDTKPTTEWLSISKNTKHSGTVSGEWDNTKNPSQMNNDYRYNLLPKK